MSSAKTALTIGDLEAGFPSYCVALRTLVSQGADLERIRRTRCWDYLQRLHTSLPRKHRSPEDLIRRYQRDLQPSPIAQSWLS
ncbi:DUF3136 domain-containing protein [Synechococcus sp. UW105]|uniref:DUF3136 domain-containing protein n=1 Tax=unclassified Synechococcus TaxID=2626047 RepID=UPI000E0F725E|nr:DUF3136 domain-containing protein [Synechococcus sp. UW105]